MASQTKSFVGGLLKSKTFALLVGIFVVATVLLILDKLAGELWLSLTQWIIGGGTLRGTAQHVQETIQEKRRETEKNIAALSDDDLARAVIERTGTTGAPAR